MKEIADECSCCVLITNQISGTGSGTTSGTGSGTGTVDSRDDGLCDHIPSGITIGTNTSNISNISNPNDLNRIMSSSYYKASLGSIWYHCISTRIVLYLEETEITNPAEVAGGSGQLGQSGTGGRKSTRILALVKSPICQHFQQPYIISNKGLVEA